MSISMNTFDTPKKTATKDWSRAYITAALWERGTSFRRLSRLHRYAPTALNQALNRPYPKAEAIIAAAIGCRPNEIWPSRYHEDGSPKSGRGERGLGRYRAKNISGILGCNVKTHEAA